MQCGERYVLLSAHFVEKPSHHAQLQKTNRGEYSCSPEHRHNLSKTDYRHHSPSTREEHASDLQNDPDRTNATIVDGMKFRRHPARRDESLHPVQASRC